MPPQTHPRRSFAIELALVLCCFSIPLFLGLNRWDFHNDESIYSYAVDRILETGEWLTPRVIPGDGPFLEKPPLKFWIVAAGIESGLLPHDEFGMRFFDALFGAIAFIYIFRLGRWLAGPGCGFIACLILFTIDSLVFEHGLRSNNMDAALFLAYCGGVYHFARWTESAPRGRMHALVVAGYFVLGFMTKFVAALFLPLVCAVALVWRRDGVRRVMAGWLDWALAGAVVVALVAPWFAYQAVANGDDVWRIMFGEHVVQRFSVSLDERHIEPWYYYFYWMWDEVTFARSRWISIAGVVMLAVGAWRGPWLARLLFVWWVVPQVLLSFATAKVFHYAYPFMPPFAIGAGWIAVLAARRLNGALVDVTGKLPHVLLVRRVPAWWRVTAMALFAAGVLLLAVAAITNATGPIRWQAGDVIVRNSSVTRPALVGAVLIVLAGTAAIRRTVVLLFAFVLLPITTYVLVVQHLFSPGAPLKAVRDCAASAQTRPDVRVYMPYDRLMNHWFYYYLRGVGEWVQTDGVDTEDLRQRLSSPDRRSLILLTMDDYKTLELESGRRLPGVAFPENVVLLTPGPYEVCGHAAVRADGTEIGRPYPPRARH